MQTTTKTPLVSVIMNCYNGEKYLDKAIASVYAQTYNNWEIVFWDNASIDGSANIAQSYDSRIKYFYTKDNTLLGQARVEAVRKANGKYIAFLDCDDIWEAAKLEKQIEVMNENPNLALVYSRCDVISGDDEVLGSIPLHNELKSGNIFDDLVKENFIPFVSVLMSKESYKNIGGFANHYKNSTDYDLFLKTAYKYDVYGIDSILCKYREHGENLSHSQYIICAKEGVESVSSFLPDRRAIIGLKYCYTNLVIGYLKEKIILKAIYLSIKHKVVFMVLARVLKSVFKK